MNFTGTQGVISGTTEMWGPTHLQTDTPINGGNSGGPLISMKTGRVIGINSSRINSKDDQNTNFAVPIEQACRILELLQNDVDPSPPRSAIDFYDTVEENAELIVARSFLDDSDIQLKEGDEIVAVGDHAVKNASELTHRLRGSLDDVNIKLRREDQLIELNGRMTPAARIVDRPGLSFSGILFATAPYQDKNTLTSAARIMVHDIERGSQGQSNDVQVYDIIVRVDGTSVRGLDHLRELLMSKGQGDENVQMDFLRLADYYGSGKLFRSVRRSLEWSTPKIIGSWSDDTRAAKLDH